MFDILGRRVAQLVDERVEPGRHAVLWDATQVASGVYVIRLSADNFVQTHRVTLLM
ncbi:MAG: T9SS type A sorting domain-containing protein [Rubricoccaceae bacterium]|nr:T9SS type A sorting domain-containing protein [Rubricoccaceae bacterium]